MGISDFIPKGPTAGIVQLPQDVVGQDDRGGRRPLGISAEAGQAKREDQEPLLALRSIFGGILTAEQHREVVALRSAERRPGGEVRKARLAPGFAQLFGRSVRAIGQVGAMVGEAGPGATRSYANVGFR